jgi:hypothetical protein
MALVLGQDRPQMPFAEDEHLVGDLGPGGEHEPFRVSVRARAAGRDVTAWGAGLTLKLTIRVDTITFSIWMVLVVLGKMARDTAGLSLPGMLY